MTSPENHDISQFPADATMKDDTDKDRDRKGESNGSNENNYDSRDCEKMRHFLLVEILRLAIGMEPFL